RRVDARARREKRLERRQVRIEGDLVVLRRRADADGRRDTSGLADTKSRAVVAGGDDRRDADRSQIVDDGPVWRGITRGREDTTTQAEIHGAEIVCCPNGVDTL